MQVHRGKAMEGDPARRQPSISRGGRPLGRNCAYRHLDLNHKIFILSQPNRERINHKMRDEMKKPVVKVGEVRSVEPWAVIRMPSHLRGRRPLSSLGYSLHVWPLLRIPARRASAPSHREVLSEEDKTRPFSNQSNQGR